MRSEGKDITEAVRIKVAKVTTFSKPRRRMLDLSSTTPAPIGLNLQVRKRSFAFHAFDRLMRREIPRLSLGRAALLLGPWPLEWRALCALQTGETRLSGLRLYKGMVGIGRAGLRLYDYRYIQRQRPARSLTRGICGRRCQLTENRSKLPFCFKRERQFYQ
jgi:hypothetical protein